MGNLMKAADLHTILTVGQTFAANDPTMPMITAVRLEFSEDKVVAAATDRFVLGVHRADYAGEAFTVLLPLDDVKNVVRIAKTTAKHNRYGAARTVVLEAQRADDNDQDVKAVTFTFSSGEAITVQTLNDEFPKFGQLIPSNHDTITADSALVKGFNAACLGKFAKVPGSHKMAVTVGGAARPTVVTIGEDFIGVVMSVRLGDAPRYQRPEWLA